MKFFSLNCQWNLFTVADWMWMCANSLFSSKQELVFYCLLKERANKKYKKVTEWSRMHKIKQEDDTSISKKLVLGASELLFTFFEHSL